MGNKRKNIVLIGMMGTGKSTVGAHLAEQLGYCPIDLDLAIVQEAGASIPELFEQRGESGFRDLESGVLEATLQGEGIVLATGGGAVLREHNRSVMSSCGWVVALTATAEDILQRVGEDKNRPLLAGGAKERVYTLLEERKHAYEFADVTVDTTDKSPEQVSAEILTHYRG